MTVYEMLIGIRDRIDKALSLASPEFPIQQELRYLNHATEKFIKLRYGNNNVHRTSFEETEKRVDDLESLVKYINLTKYSDGVIFTSSVSSTNFKKPEDYWFSIMERAELQFDKCGKTVTIIDKVPARRHNELGSILDDPFNRPDKNNVFRVMAGGMFQLVHAKDVTPLSFQLGYISKYNELILGVNVQVDNPNGTLYYKKVEFTMPRHTHPEIMDIAADLYLEGVGDPRINTFQKELMSQE